jgi:hypothetical protein
VLKWRLSVASAKSEKIASQKTAIDVRKQQTTVAELKSYRNPPPAIVDTMRAVFILLGENGKSLKTYSEISVRFVNIMDTI